MAAQIEDIRNESLIRRKWNFPVSNPFDYPEGILITGANSFIGCHLVSILQNKNAGPLHLLVRAPSEHEALIKIQQSFLNWGLGEVDKEDVVIHVGDVSKNRMNLNQAEFLQLKKEVGRVVHLAGTPLYHLPYEHFKRVWIPELERMIAFCGDPAAPKSLHYASSFNTNFFQTEEDFKALNTNAWQSGYAGFKWIANKAILNAMALNLRGCIYDIPLVLGSETNGICPGHYTIWLILDIFLKTGCYFPFSFRIIPVDTLAEIIAFNIEGEKENKSTSFVRPVLSEPVTDKMFSRMVASMLGLKETEMETVKKACRNKLRFDFIMPGNFYDLMERVNNLPSVFPRGFDEKNLPLAPLVFIRNLNHILTRSHENIERIYQP